MTTPEKITASAPDPTANIAKQGASSAIKPPPAADDSALAWAAESLRIDFAAAAERRRKAFLKRIGMIVGIPTLLAAFYVFVYATPRYISEFQIVYQSNSPAGSGTNGGLLSSVLGSAGAGTDMPRVLGSYLVSSALLATLDKQLHLRAHFSDSSIDWLDRLSADASDEEFLKYFQKRVTVSVLMGGYLIVDVEAFDPKYAQQIGVAMAADADKMVEDLTERSRLDEMKFAQSQITRAQQNLLQAKLNTTEFRNRHRQFNPQANAEQLETSVVGGLEGQLSQYRSQLASRRPFLGDNSPTIRALNAQIGAVEQQIASERGRLANSDTAAGKGASIPYSDIVAQYTTLTQNEVFAADEYVSAKQAYDIARSDAARKQNYVESFVPPNLPQEATAPNGWRTVLATFLFALLAYAAGSLLTATLREQAGI